MALKLKLTKAEYDALPDAVKAEYKADGDAYKLDVSDLPDTGALERAHVRTKEELNEAKRVAKEAQDKLDALGVDAARKAGDIATLEKSWKEKSEAEVGKRDSRIQLLETGLKNAAITEATSKIASKLTEHTSILSPHIRSRITAEIDPETGLAVTRFLDKDGKVSALSADDLQKEFAENKEFSAIIRVSKATGGNAGGAGNGANGANRIGNNPDEKADLSKVSPGDLAARIAAKKGETLES
jgi:hypothetical protein